MGGVRELLLVTAESRVGLEQNNMDWIRGQLYWQYVCSRRRQISWVQARVENVHHSVVLCVFVPFILTPVYTRFGGILDVHNQPGSHSK